MQATSEMPVTQTINEALVLIDNCTSEIGQKGRTLVESLTVVDLLLDLRLSLSRLRN